MEFLDLIRRPEATVAASAATRLSCIDE